MVLLTAADIKKSYITRTLLSNVSFQVSEGDRVGLIGINGCGKTTLFHIITQEEPFDSGELHLSKNAVLGYVRQHADSTSRRSAYDEVLTVFEPLMETERELAQITEKISGERDEQRLDALVRRQHALSEFFEREGGYTFRARARSTLAGLGVDEEMQQREFRSLSGGEKAKVLLARMLLSDANLLLLDEPTNHLDIAAVEWLEEYLLSYRGAYIVISHDRYFLDRVTNRTFEIENGRLLSYTGNYSAFMEKKAHERDIAQRYYNNTMREIKRIEGIVAQQRQWNRERNIRTAESKLKEIERLKENLVKPEEEPEALRFRFFAPPAVTNDVVACDDLSKSFGEKTLFSGVELLIKNGERAFLLGPNGCGKTTLFKILLGMLSPDSGRRMIGPGVKTGYYDQNLSALSPEKQVIDELWDAYPTMTQTAIRTALGRFLFKGDDVFKRVGSLSGGERARLCLLKLMLSGANLLFLDEPTNHLDIASREALEDALLEFHGTLFVISHDRYFINKLASQILVLDPDGVTSYDGDYDAFLKERERELAQQDKQEKKENPQEKKAVGEYRAAKESRANIRRMRARLGAVERESNELNAELSALSDELCDPDTAADYLKVTEITQKIDAIKARLEGLEEEWLQLAEMLEE
ncbi:MAG: ATP-binding cassette domain-containing protein [Christensenellales bacterium]